MYYGSLLVLCVDLTTPLNIPRITPALHYLFPPTGYIGQSRPQSVVFQGVHIHPHICRVPYLFRERLDQRRQYPPLPPYPQRGLREWVLLGLGKGFLALVCPLVWYSASLRHLQYFPRSAIDERLLGIIWAKACTVANCSFFVGDFHDEYFAFFILSLRSPSFL